MYRNAKLMLYLYACFVILLLLAIVYDFKTASLLICFCVNMVTSKYIIVKKYGV